jgi:plastocyanin
MKKLVLTMALALWLSVAMAQTTHQVTSSGLTYTPGTLTVNVGDTVEFMVGAGHPTREVSQATWQSNGTTALPGGFDFPSGNAKVYIATAKTYYYICTSHAAQGMKGQIVAQNTVGADEHQLVDIEIFPNPVGEVLNFSLNLDEALKTATIYNLSGKAVKTLDLTQSADEVRSFNISDLKAGSYILKLENGNTAKEIRFVKK